MHIMITNDDGIHALGIAQLVRAARAAGHTVTVCAPDGERSAASHSLSLLSALRARSMTLEGATAYAINGTPADCARLGLYLLRDTPVDLVISGINRGANLGGACAYSGTIGAAVEAAMRGFPAMATSLDDFRATDYSAAATVTLRFADWMMAHPLPTGVIYNLNVPALPYDTIRGLVYASLGPRFLAPARYAQVAAPYDHTFYFVDDAPDVGPFPEDCDVSRIRAGYATVTPLSWNSCWSGPVDALDPIL